MRTDPVTDVLNFLTRPSYSEPYWLHYVYWALAATSVAIAIAALRLPPVRSRLIDGERFVIRFILASFWWQQSLWKFPTDTGGLRYWTEQEVAHSAYAIQATLVKTLVLPIFQPFAYCVYAFETLVAVTLFLGIGVRIFGSLGALLIFSLFTGLYRDPTEWPWGYFFLVMLMVIMVVEDYGTSLGLDSWGLVRWPRGRRRG